MPKPRFRSHDPPWPRRFGMVHGTATGSGESLVLYRSFPSRLALKVLGILRHLWPIGAAELYHTHVSCFSCWISCRGNWSQPTRRRLFNFIKAKLFCCLYLFCLYAKSGCPSYTPVCIAHSKETLRFHWNGKGWENNTRGICIKHDRNVLETNRKEEINDTCVINASGTFKTVTPYMYTNYRLWMLKHNGP